MHAYNHAVIALSLFAAAFEIELVNLEMDGQGFLRETVLTSRRILHKIIEKLVGDRRNLPIIHVERFGIYLTLR